MRGAELFLELSGLAASRSLRQPPKPYFSVRMLDLIRLLPQKTVTIRGSELIWQYLKAMQIPWEDGQVLLYESLQPGWSYFFDVNAKRFIVTDDTSAVVTHENITGLSEVGISWVILESEQFLIKATGDFTWDAFLIATRQDAQRASQSTGYRWGEADAYLNAVMHAVYDRLMGLLAVPAGELGLIIDGQDYDAITRLWDILLPYVSVLAAWGEYPVNLQPGEQGQTGTRQLTNRPSQMATIGRALMIYLFADKLLNGSEPVLEPWLLWKLFQWWGQGSITAPADRIFDLSPWWG